MGSEGKNVEKQPVAVGLSKKAYKNVLSFVPSQDEMDKYDRLRLTLVGIRRSEAGEREKENPEGWLNAALGDMDASGEKVKNMVNEDDVGAIKDILKSGTDIDKKDVLRYHLLHNFLSRKGFKKNHKDWKGEYKEKKANQPDFKMSEKDYVYERGMQKIRDNRDLIIKGRISAWVEKAGEKQEGLDEAVLKFLGENETKLVNEKSDKNILSKQFVQIFLEHGYGEEDIKGLEALFDEIVGDIEYAAVMQQAYSDSYEKMIAMSGQDVTDEEWDKQVMKELEAKAKGEMKEAVEQIVKQMGWAPTGVVKTPEISYGSVSDIANANAVSIRPEGGDLYSIQFPSLEKTYSPKMKIVLPKGSNDLNLATYIIEDEFADENVPNSGDEIGKGKRSVAYAAEDLPRVLARIQLDYRLHKAARETGENGITPDEVNKVFPDQRLIKMSERLFNFKIGQQPVLPQHMSKYENLLSVLLKPDGRNNFVQRAMDMEHALNDDGMVPYIRRNLNKVAPAKVFTVSELLKKAELDRAGEKNETKRREE